MLRVRVYDNGRLLDGNEDLLATAGPKWIDVLQPTEEVLNKLGERFGLHKLAIEDCLHLDQRPKLEEYGNHQFLVLQGFSTPTEKWADLEMHELHFFIGPDWLITVHDMPDPDKFRMSRQPLKFPAHIFASQVHPTHDAFDPRIGVGQPKQPVRFGQ